MAAVVVCAALPAHAADAPVAAPAPPSESYRIRIENRTGGAIEVSGNSGRSWEPLGKVTRPASSILASSNVLSVSAPATVAGCGPDQILLRIPAGKDQYRALRVLAQEEGEAAGAISTSLPAASGLFRCLAPPPGSELRLERDDHVDAVPANYGPRIGDRLQIIVRPSADDPVGVTLENKEGGQVVEELANGTSKPLARVKQPLRGIGRYAGTERAGAGAILNWSPTLVMVSTAGSARKVDEKQQPVEDRGGFIIQPAEPALKGSTHPASQVLLEALPQGDTKPVISPFFGLGVPLSTGDPLDKNPSHVEVRIDGGNWEPFPDLRGPINDDQLLPALRTALGPSRKVETGITHIRVVFARPTPASLARRIRLAVSPAESQPQRGSVKITANIMGEGVSLVTFYLDGTLVAATNQAPYIWEWNTARSQNGPHLVEIRGSDAKGATVTSRVTRVTVDN
jgi:hypothetical protein